MAETPVVPASTALFCVADVAANACNISASSERAASSELNATGCAIQREPADELRAASSANSWPAATSVPCVGVVVTSACPAEGVSNRNASANSSSLGDGSSASGSVVAATGCSTLAGLGSSTLVSALG